MRSPPCGRHANAGSPSPDNALLTAFFRSLLGKVLSLIRAHPGIRPSELNRRLNREQSDGLRNTLIKRGLIRKKKDGTAMRYYPI